MKKLLLITALCATTAASPAALAQFHDALPSDSRIKMLNYDEADVYTITTRYGYQTNIVFARGEEVQTISVGDRSLWQIIPSSNRLFIRPMEENVTTNMTVITNRHSYQFDLKSVAVNNKAGGNIYVAQFVYPEDRARQAMMMQQQQLAQQPMMAPPPPPPGAMPPPPPPMAMEQEEPLAEPAPISVNEPTELAHASQPVDLVQEKGGEPPANVPEEPSEPTPPPVHDNYNYTYSGPDAIAPLQVYDDGKTTYLKYRSSKTVPQVFVVEDGKQVKVTTHKKNGMVTVNKVAGEILLKSKAGTVHVYNELINPQQ